MSQRVHLITVITGVMVVVLVLALGFGAKGSRAAVSQTINAFFDAEGNLKFVYLDGSAVAGSIPPGTYQVIYNNYGADDVADDHAFHLFGPGVDFAPAPDVIQRVFSVTFQTNGNYTVQDDRFPAIGRRTFVASASGGSEPSPAPAGTTTTAKSSTKPVSNDIVGSELKPFRGTLAGAVSSAGKLSLTFHGKRVVSLKSGRYTIAVDDKAAKTAFKVQRAKKSPVTLTGPAFIGKRSATVTLDAGQWWFFSSGNKKSYFVVVV